MQERSIWLFNCLLVTYISDAPSNVGGIDSYENESVWYKPNSTSYKSDRMIPVGLNPSVCLAHQLVKLASVKWENAKLWESNCVVPAPVTVNANKEPNPTLYLNMRTMSMNTRSMCNVIHSATCTGNVAHTHQVQDCATCRLHVCSDYLSCSARLPEQSTSLGCNS